MRRAFNKSVFRMALAVGFIVLAGSYMAGGSDVWKVEPRIFTPGSNQNTVVNFSYSGSVDTPLPLGRIYDIQGHHVSDLGFDSESGGKFTATWEGKNINNNPARSGIYIYQVIVSTKVYNGTVVLAR